MLWKVRCCSKMICFWRVINARIMTHSLCLIKVTKHNEQQINLMRTQPDTNGLFFILQFISFYYSGNITQSRRTIIKIIMSEGLKAAELMGCLYTGKQWVNNTFCFHHLSLSVCPFQVYPITNLFCMLCANIAGKCDFNTPSLLCIKSN